MRRGYVLDVAYSAGFYPQTAPEHLGFAALVAGWRLGAGLPPRRVYELGFGQGFGLALLAAANPQTQFEGCDFIADHVVQARRFVTDARLENIDVAHEDFAAAARRGARDVDLVIAHGVLSWISPQARSEIAAFLERRLGDAGGCYISYNSQPAWAALQPVRDLMLLARRRVTGETRDQLGTALEWLAEMRRANAAYFVANPFVARQVDRILTADRAELAHEYFAEDACAMGFGEVAAFAEPSGLRYVASAALMENFDSYMVPAALPPLLARTGDPILRESLRDFAANRFFRQDLFARGAAPVSEAERVSALSSWRFLLASPRAGVSFEFQTPFGAMQGRAELYGPLADRLALRPTAFQDLLTEPPFDALGATSLIECLCILVDSRQVFPVADGPQRDAAPAKRFNRLVVDAARQGRIYSHLASPATGSGVAVDDFDLLALAALFDGASTEPAALAQRGFEIVSALGRRPTRDGAEIEDEAEAVASLVEPMRRAAEEKLPVWRRLEIL